MSAAAFSPFKADIGFVIALQEELNHFWVALKDYGVQQPHPSWRQPIAGGGYFLPFVLNTVDNSVLTCVIAFIGDQTRGPAKEITAHLLRQHCPGLIINVGISGGLKDAALGMVVIADSIDDFTVYGAIIEEEKDDSKWDLQLSGTHFSPSLATRLAAASIEVANPPVFEQYKVAARAAKASCLADVPNVEVDREYAQLTFSDDAPVGTAGPFVCSDFVLKAESFKLWLLKRRDRRFIAADCESAGVAAAVHQSTYDPATVVQHVYIRGISDLCDRRKSSISIATNNAMRKLAMLNVSHFITVLLQRRVLVPPTTVDLVGDYLALIKEDKILKKRKRALRDRLKLYIRENPQQAAEGFRDATGSGRVRLHSGARLEQINETFLRNIEQQLTVPDEVDDLMELRETISSSSLKAEEATAGTYDHLPTAKIQSAAAQPANFTVPRPGSIDAFFPRGQA